jgi:hypothetical protein
LPTGISVPYLDFYLENETTIIGFESKFTEYFEKQAPNHDNNLQPYIRDWATLKKYLPDAFRNEILEHYVMIFRPERAT